MRMKGLKHGFTLVEMLAVVAILAIVSALIAPTLVRVISDTKNKADTSKAQVYTSSMQKFASEAVGNAVQYANLSAQDYNLLAQEAGKGNYPGYGVAIPASGSATELYKSIRREAAIALKAFTGTNVDSNYFVNKPQDSSKAYVYYYLDGSVALKPISEMHPLSTVDVASNMKEVNTSDYWVFLSDPGGAASYGSGLGVTEESTHLAYIKVVDQKNLEALEDAKVTLSGGTGSVRGYQGATASTGLFIINDIKEGTYNIGVTRTGYWDFPTDSVYAGAGGTSITVNSAGDYVGNSPVNPLIIRLSRGITENTSVGLYTKTKKWNNAARTFELSDSHLITGSQTSGDLNATIAFGPQSNATTDTRVETYTHASTSDVSNYFKGRFLLHDGTHALNCGLYNLGVTVDSYQNRALNVTVGRDSVTSPGVVNKTVVVDGQSINEYPVDMRKKLTTVWGTITQESTNQPNRGQPTITGTELPESKLQDIATTVKLVNTVDATKTYSTTVNSDGTYKIVDIPDGTYSFAVTNQYKPNGYSDFPTTITCEGYDTEVNGATPKTDKTVCNPTIFLKYDDDTHDPIPGASVTLERLNEDGTKDTRVTSTNGSVAYANKEAGFYNAYVKVPWEPDVTYTYKMLIIDSNNYVLYYDYGYHSDATHGYKKVYGTGYVMSGSQKDANYDNYGLNLVKSTLYNANASSLLTGASAQPKFVGTLLTYAHDYGVTQYGTSALTGDTGSWSYNSVRPGIYDITFSSQCTYDKAKRVTVRLSDSALNQNEIIFADKPENLHPKLEKVPQTSDKLRDYFKVPYESSKTQHRIICSVCGRPFELEDHTPNALGATCSQDKECWDGYDLSKSTPDYYAAYQTDTTRPYYKQCGEILQAALGHSWGPLQYSSGSYGIHYIDCIRYNNWVTLSGGLVVDWGCHHRMWTGTAHTYNTYTYTGPYANLSAGKGRAAGGLYEFQYTGNDSTDSRPCTFSETVTGRNEHCNYVDSKAHNFVWESDDTYHWQRCVDCGLIINHAEHDHAGYRHYCTDSLRCSECGKILAFPVSTVHNFRYAQDPGNLAGDHIVTCANWVDGHQCEYYSKEPHKNVRAKALDGTHHAFYCSKCGATFGQEEHDFSDAEAIEKIAKINLGHGDYDEEYYYDPSQHNAKCGVCDYPKKQAHQWAHANLYLGDGHKVYRSDYEYYGSYSEYWTKKEKSYNWHNRSCGGDSYITNGRVVNDAHPPQQTYLTGCGISEVETAKPRRVSLGHGDYDIIDGWSDPSLAGLRCNSSGAKFTGGGIYGGISGVQYVKCKGCWEGARSTSKVDGDYDCISVYVPTYPSMADQSGYWDDAPDIEWVD